MTGAGDEYRLADRFRGVASLAGENGDVLEAAQRAERHFAEEVEIEHRERRNRHRERMVLGNRAALERHQWDEHKGAIRDELRGPAEGLHPFADAQAEHRECRNHHDQPHADHRRVPRGAREPGAARADEIGEIRRDHHAERRENEDRVRPEIPRRDESPEFTEGNRRPLIEPALERHQPVQVDHDGGLRKVEQRDGREPEHDVAGAELGRSADPSRTHHIHDLGENECRQAKLFAKAGTVIFDGENPLRR